MASFLSPAARLLPCLSVFPSFLPAGFLSAYSASTSAAVSVSLPLLSLLLLRRRRRRRRLLLLLPPLQLRLASEGTNVLPYTNYCRNKKKGEEEERRKKKEEEEEEEERERERCQRFVFVFWSICPSQNQHQYVCICTNHLLLLLFLLLSSLHVLTLRFHHVKLLMAIRVSFSSATTMKFGSPQYNKESYWSCSKRKKMAGISQWMEDTSIEQ